MGYDQKAFTYSTDESINNRDELYNLLYCYQAPKDEKERSLAGLPGDARYSAEVQTYLQSPAWVTEREKLGGNTASLSLCTWFQEKF